MSHSGAREKAWSRHTERERDRREREREREGGRREQSSSKHSRSGSHLPGSRQEQQAKQQVVLVGAGRVLLLCLCLGLPACLSINPVRPSATTRPQVPLTLVATKTQTQAITPPVSLSAADERHQRTEVRLPIFELSSTLFHVDKDCTERAATTWQRRLLVGRKGVGFSRWLWLVVLFARFSFFFFFAWWVGGRPVAYSRASQPID